MRAQAVRALTPIAPGAREGAPVVRDAVQLQHRAARGRRRCASLRAVLLLVLVAAAALVVVVVVGAALPQPTQLRQADHHETVLVRRSCLRAARARTRRSPRTSWSPSTLRRPWSGQRLGRREHRDECTHLRASDQVDGVRPGCAAVAQLVAQQVEAVAPRTRRAVRCKKRGLGSAGQTRPRAPQAGPLKLERVKRVVRGRVELQLLALSQSVHARPPHLSGDSGGWARGVRISEGAACVGQTRRCLWRVYACRRVRHGGCRTCGGAASARASSPSCASSSSSSSFSSSSSASAASRACVNVGARTSAPTNMQAGVGCVCRFHHNSSFAARWRAAFHNEAGSRRALTARFRAFGSLPILSLHRMLCLSARWGALT